MSVTPLFNEHMPRFLRPDVATRTAKHLESAIHSASRSNGPDAGAIDEKVKKSLSSIEKLVENYSALQENADHFKGLAEANAHELKAEKEMTSHLSRMLEQAQTRSSELESSLSSEQLRLREAQTTIAALERMLGELEDENTTTRAQALRLVQGVEFLMAAENNIHLKKTSALARSA